MRRGSTRTRFTVRKSALQERPPVLERYLETFTWQVQGYFEVRAGGPESEFVPIAAKHPVFELIAKA